MFLVESANEAPWTTLSAAETPTTCVRRIYALIDEFEEILAPSVGEVMLSEGQPDLGCGIPGEVTRDGHNLEE